MALQSRMFPGILRVKESSGLHREYCITVTVYVYSANHVLLYWLICKSPLICSERSEALILRLRRWAYCAAITHTPLAEQSKVYRPAASYQSWWHSQPLKATKEMVSLAKWIQPATSRTYKVDYGSYYVSSLSAFLVGFYSHLIARLPFSDARATTRFPCSLQWSTTQLP